MLNGVFLAWGTLEAEFDFCKFCILKFQNLQKSAFSTIFNHRLKSRSY